MQIQKFSLINVRKLKKYSGDLGKYTNIFLGKNGAGKTSILEAIYFMSCGKSFRKKYYDSIINKTQEELQILLKIKNNSTNKITVKYKPPKKVFNKNNKIISKTSDLLKEISLVCISPEETDVIEEYKKEKQKYFDRIIFKVNNNHAKNINNYNKLINYRNTLLENNMDTKPWDDALIETGIKIWKEREKFFKIFCIVFEKVEKQIKEKKTYSIEYKNNFAEEDKYREKINKKTTNNKTEIGPHKDEIYFYINKRQLKEHGSQGEKKIFKYLLKFTEATVMENEKKIKPTILIDDFFAKLDKENIMKTFNFFHRKFQTIITTTNTETQLVDEIKDSDTKIFYLND